MHSLTVILKCHVDVKGHPTRNVYWPCASCVSVCLSVPRRISALLHGPDVTWGMVDVPLVVQHIGQICNRCTGFVAMTTQSEGEMSASACILALCLVRIVLSVALAAKPIGQGAQSPVHFMPTGQAFGLPYHSSTSRLIFLPFPNELTRI